MFRRGVVNAGILDAEFALQWVQEYIYLFGGNASEVTISGLSAGGGAVMLLDMAYGGTLGTSLFRNSITASPYLPMQYGYKDWIPSQSYYAFAIAAGCNPFPRYGNNSDQTLFDCLVAQNTTTLQYASFNVSTSGTYGTWGFLPVTDGVFIQDIPSRQLLAKKVNGLRQMSGNNGDEGPPFVPQDITSIEDLVAWLELTFPLFSNNDLAKVLLYYPSNNATTEDGEALRFATAGDMGATAVNTSEVSAGQQQRANVSPPVPFSFATLRCISADACRRTYTQKPPSSVHPTGWRKRTAAAAAPTPAAATSTNSPCPSRTTATTTTPTSDPFPTTSDPTSPWHSCASGATS